jgi:hypothetical protein
MAAWFLGAQQAENSPPSRAQIAEQGVKVHQGRAFTANPPLRRRRPILRRWLMAGQRPAAQSMEKLESGPVCREIKQ